jgi:hypothetical protein
MNEWWREIPTAHLSLPIYRRWIMGNSSQEFYLPYTADSGATLKCLSFFLVSPLPLDSFWFLVCDATTTLAIQLHQERKQVVRSNRVVRKLPIEWNGTLAMDLGHMNVVLKWYICMLVVDSVIIIISIISIIILLGRGWCLMDPSLPHSAPH